MCYEEITQGLRHSCLLGPRPTDISFSITEEDIRVKRGSTEMMFRRRIGGRTKFNYCLVVGLLSISFLAKLLLHWPRFGKSAENSSVIYFTHFPGVTD